jgi:hypothetical protein
MSGKGQNKVSLSEKGFTLIQVMVSIALLSISVSLYFQMSGRMKSAAKRLAGSENFTDVEGALRSEMSYFLSQIKSQPGCLSYGNVFASRSIASENGTMAINFTRQLDDRQAFGYRPVLNQRQIREALRVMAKTPKTGTALARCRRSVRPAQFDNNNHNKFYFCLDLIRDPNATPDSFMASDRAFVEVGVELMNTNNSSPISCAGFATAPSGVGAEIYLTTYWLIRASGFVYKSHSSSYFLDKP